MRDPGAEGRLTAWRGLVRAAAVGAVIFYAATAHLTRGFEADFGKQWLAGRLVATGEATRLYNPEAQRAELERHFTPDVIERGIWREGIGGPTYPPTLAVLFAPLGLLNPRSAQWLMVQLSLVLAVLSARTVSWLTQNRISTPLAVLLILSMPSFFLALGLGQNSAMSLALLTFGWALLARNHDYLAGAVWGLFAFKPTWGIAVGWLPLLVGRPRVYATMALAACGLVGLTLPICGWECWVDWVGVARQTEHLYETLPRWTALSRDLTGLVRRFDHGSHVEFAGCAAIGFILVVTGWAWRAGRAQAWDTSVTRAVALLSCAILACPRFMFYDMSLAVLPVWIGCAGWSQLRLIDRWVFTSSVALLWLGVLASYCLWHMTGPPIDTFAILLLWAWAAVQTIRAGTSPDHAPDSPPSVGSADATAGAIGRAQQESV